MTPGPVPLSPAAAGTAALQRRPRFALAADADEPEVRRILRENPMPGPIALSLEREPDSRLAAHVEGPLLHQTVVGRRPGGGLFGFGTRAVRTMFVNGEPRPVGYLGGLRLDADHRGHALALRQGYRHFRALHDRDRLVPFYLTSILTENAPARRLLEANLPGMPTYRLVGEMVTLVMRVRRSASRTDIPVCPLAAGEADLLREGTAVPPARGQFTSPIDFDAPHGPAPEDVRIARDGDRIRGCAAFWDQRAFRQTIVRGYAPSIARWRPLLNVGLALAGRPALPRVGAPIRSAFVASLHADTPGIAVALVESIHAIAATRGLDYLSVGLPAGSATLAALRRAFGGRGLHSRLYVVFWPDGRDAADALDDRVAWPEVALL